MAAQQAREWALEIPGPMHHPAARFHLGRKGTLRTGLGHLVANNRMFLQGRKGTPPTGRGPQGAEGHQKPAPPPAPLLESLPQGGGHHPGPLGMVLCHPAQEDILQAGLGRPTAREEAVALAGEDGEIEEVAKY